MFQIKSVSFSRSRWKIYIFIPQRSWVKVDSPASNQTKDFSQGCPSFLDYSSFWTYSSWQPTVGITIYTCWKEILLKPLSNHQSSGRLILSFFWTSLIFTFLSIIWHFAFLNITVCFGLQIFICACMKSYQEHTMNLRFCYFIRVCECPQVVYNPTGIDRGTGNENNDVN